MSIIKTQTTALSSQLSASLAEIQSLVLNPKTYVAEISRTTPTALVFLIDQSGSMGNIITHNGQSITLAQALANVVNGLLDELLLSVTRNEGARGYFDLLMIGYGKKNGECQLMWDTTDPANPWVNTTDLEAQKISEIEVEETRKTRSGTQTIQVKKPIWIEAVASGQTPMQHALNTATMHIANWIKRYPNSFPPIVFNITDGAATDADNDHLLATAYRLKQVHTTDGNVLLFNIHLSPNEGDEAFLPTSLAELPSDDYAKQLYEMSSVLPDTPMFRARLADICPPIQGNNMPVAMAYNVSEMTKIWRLLQIGTVRTVRI